MTDPWDAHRRRNAIDDLFLTAEKVASTPRGLRGRVLARFDDAVAAVRAYAESAPPPIAVELLKVLEQTKHQRDRFELLTRASK